MYFDKKASCRYLRRRHKLYKAINNDLHDTSSLSVPLVQNLQSDQNENQSFRKAFAQVFTVLLEDSFDIFTFLETTKIIKSKLHRFSRQFLQNIVLATGFQSGHKLAYVVYRICKQSPQLFRKFSALLQNFLFQPNQQYTNFSIQWCIFYTDLLLYGFAFTVKTYTEKVFLHCEGFIVDFVIRMPTISQWSVFMPKKYQFKLKSLCQNWINELIRMTKAQHEEMKVLQQRIQQLIVESKRSKDPTVDSQEYVRQQQDQQLSIKYVDKFGKYEETRDKLEYIDRNEGVPPAKEIEQVRRQCDFYDPNFSLPELLHRLYKEREIAKMQIQRVKTNQMVGIFQDEAFLTQLRMCGSIQKAVDLGSYFIANLSTQRNRQQLIEYIIDYCHHQSNLDLIMKVLAEINCCYQQIGELLNKKAHKIASQLKMNKKYLNLVCEGIKYGMIDSSIVLEYLEKRLQTEHTEISPAETVRECCGVLELLGQGIYHQSLSNNIEINKLFRLIQEKIKQKKLNFEFVFNLKCLQNYLRKPSSLPQFIEKSAQLQENETLSQLVGQFTLRQHFDLILKRIKELLANKTANKTEESYHRKRTLNYILNSVENQSTFIQTFYEASLLKEINHKQLSQQILQQSIHKIQTLIMPNIQQALKWSRFLGELYNYEIINRKKLSQILETNLLYCEELSSAEIFQQVSKCIFECLNISKGYIMESELQKQGNQYILHFLIKFKRSILKYLQVKSPQGQGIFDNVMIQQELEELFERFHPALLMKFKTVDENDLWVRKVKFSSPKDSLLSVNLYKILQYYLQVETVDQFDPTQIEGMSHKGKRKQENECKTKTSKRQENGGKLTKKVLYKQKIIEPTPKPQTKPIPQSIKPTYSKIEAMQRQIEQINQNYRNQENEQLQEEQKQVIKQEGQSLQRELKEMMGITPQIEMNEKFPQLNQRNLKTTKRAEQSTSCGIGNLKKILKRQQGKKIKIIARRTNPNTNLIA